MTRSSPSSNRKKPIVAFIESGGDQPYYLASACDKVFLMPTASLDLTGMANYELFLRGAARQDRRAAGRDPRR